MPLRSVSVFCGSSKGKDPVFAETVRALGRLLAAREIRVVFGGGNVGLMGELAEAVLEAGGRITGVIPRHLMAYEVGHQGLTELRVVGSMHERKAVMADLSEAFIACPGGLGTLEELFEVWTWAQIGLHAKPCAIVNTAGYFDHLEAFLDHAVAEGFLKPVHRAMVVVEREPAALLDRLESFRFPEEALDLGRWIDRPEV